MLLAGRPSFCFSRLLGQKHRSKPAHQYSPAACSSLLGSHCRSWGDSLVKWKLPYRINQLVWEGCVCACMHACIRHQTALLQGGCLTLRLREKMSSVCETLSWTNFHFQTFHFRGRASHKACNSENKCPCWNSMKINVLTALLNIFFLAFF